jgi:Fe-S cluster assembly protein SufB
MDKKDYKYGFFTNVETEDFPFGLNEKIIEKISSIKNEPAFMLDFRLKAFKIWKKMKEPHWASFTYNPIKYNELKYFSAPKKPKYSSMDEVDPEIIKTFDRLGIPISEQKKLAGVAVDAVFDSVSLGTTHQDELSKYGIIFCSMSEAILKYPDLVKTYLGSVVPANDNFFAALNSAVFSDGSFCYIPKNTISPIDLSTYFRINAANTGQFERTLIVADENSSVSYLEGCTAPMRDENQLHAAVVEIVALPRSKVKYSTVQNWYSGDENGKGGILNFVTKRGKCEESAHISWTQVEAGAAITWKYPSVVLKGDNSSGEFYSVAVTNNKMLADTGSKMIHLGKNSKSTIISKGISTDSSLNTYRGLVRIGSEAKGAHNFSQCDSLLIGPKARAYTYPYIEVKNRYAKVEHEATTSRFGEDQLIYLQSRGLTSEEAISLLVNGYCKSVFNELPMEFLVEAIKLLEMKLEGSVG